MTVVCLSARATAAAAPSLGWLLLFRFLLSGLSLQVQSFKSRVHLTGQEWFWTFWSGDRLVWSDDPFSLAPSLV